MSTIKSTSHTVTCGYEVEIKNAVQKIFAWHFILGRAIGYRSVTEQSGQAAARIIMFNGATYPGRVRRRSVFLWTVLQNFAQTTLKFNLYFA